MFCTSEPRVRTSTAERNQNRSKGGDVLGEHGLRRPVSCEVWYVGVEEGRSGRRCWQRRS